MFTVFRMLLMLIHFSCDLFAAFYNYCMILHHKCIKIWYNENLRTETDMLTRAAKRMKNLPRHVVIIFGAKEDTICDCVRIVGWCYTLGIPYISFFDISGNVHFCLLLYNVIVPTIILSLFLTIRIYFYVNLFEF